MTPASSPVPFDHHASNGLAEYVFYSRYAQFRPELGRRESYAEAVRRVADMHRVRFAPLLASRVSTADLTRPPDDADRALLAELLDGATVESVLAGAFTAVTAKWVLPSMRSLQFGGEAIHRHPARMFNCAFSPADRPEFFREFFYLQLAGTGCGFSVQREHVARLPALPAHERDGRHTVHHLVADSIEGWADALHTLIRTHYEGFGVEFDYGEVRPRGEAVVTAGGTAPGPEPLRRMLAKVDALLAEAAGRRLRPIEVYDLCMLITRAVRRDGARRSASLCLFSPEDEEMVQAKTGDWLRQHPQRAGSNNSAVVLRPTADEARFRHLLAACRSHGEPGIFFSHHPDHGCNPCGEAGLHPVLTGPFTPEIAARLRAAGYTGPLAPATRLSGWQMCNLTTINGAALATADRLFTAAVHAAVIGTLQAAYTDIDYLGPVTRVLNERDALLGVSICGFLDQPGLLLAPRLLERAARLCRAANEAMARALGIRPAARVTCVKPEGTASLLLGTAAGIHPHHARRYFRRILADRNDPVYQRFQARNPEMTEPSAMQPGTDDCITFPVEAPPHASVRDDFSAVEFLDLVRLVRRHWVLAGEAPHPPSPGLHHNVSHTCTVRAEEWDDVADYLWRHRDEFSGVALLPAEAARHYPQPPLQAATENDAAFWNSLRCRPVDYQGVGAPWSAGNRDADEPCAAGRCDAP